MIKRLFHMHAYCAVVDSLRFLTMYVNSILSAVTFISILTPSLGEINAEGRTGDNIFKWKPVRYPINTIAFHPEPAGLEDGHVVYLCRGRFKLGDERHGKPGKLVAREGLIYCSVAHDKELQIRKFEMLDVPAGSLSWVKSTGPLPSNVLLGGNSKAGVHYFVCRAMGNGNLYVGYILEDGQACHVTNGDKEHTITEGIEILVVNTYGQMLTIMAVDKKSGAIDEDYIMSLD